jgi:hypothetical protein
MTMIVALLAVNVGDLSAERSDTQSSWMRLVRTAAVSRTGAAEEI